MIVTAPDGRTVRLTGTELRIIDELHFLSEQQRSRSPKGAAYAIPGRRWLAQRCGVTVWQVSRATSRLANLGLLSKSQRRPQGGRWRSCIYWVHARTAWAAARVNRVVRAAFNRVRFTAHIAKSKQLLESKEPPRSATAAILEGGGPPKTKGGERGPNRMGEIWAALGIERPSRG